VVGSTFDSNFNWAHAFIWQDGVMTDPKQLPFCSRSRRPDRIRRRNDLDKRLSGVHHGCRLKRLAVSNNRARPVHSDPSRDHYPEGHRVKVYFVQDMLLPAYDNHTIPQTF
jgi:hypothetical protein